MATAVREKVVDRDGYCRLQGVGAFGSCNGPSEWAHIGESKRFKTRGMEPEERHSTAGTMMLCRYHHHRYDSNQSICIEELTPKRADGRCRFSLRDDPAVVYEEAA